MDNEHRVVATTCSILSLLGIDMLVWQASRAMSAPCSRLQRLTPHIQTCSLLYTSEQEHIGFESGRCLTSDPPWPTLSAYMNPYEWTLLHSIPQSCSFRQTKCFVVRVKDYSQEEILYFAQRRQTESCILPIMQRLSRFRKPLHCLAEYVDV